MLFAGWFRSRAGLFLTSVLVPPLGIALLWTRTATGAGKKLLGSVALALLGLAYLFLFFGVRMEVDGSGSSPLFSFYKPTRHFAKLERNRTRQRQSAAGPSLTPASVQPVSSITAPQAALGAETVATRTAASGSAAIARAYWTDFRGPRRDGHYDEMPIATAWPEDGLPLVWRQPVGGGYASFVVANRRAFTIEQRRQFEVAAAYDVKTGRELWTNAWAAEFREAMGGDGPRATPTWDEGRVYVLGATGEFRCLEDATGKVIWSRNILTDNQAQQLTWGMAASPLIVDDKVIVLPGGPAGKSVVAYHKLAGKPIWKVLGDQQAYTSPMLVKLGGMRQILVVSARRAMGLAVEDGALLWDYPWVTDYGINAAQPLIIGDNRFFISAGYGHGAAVVEVSRAGKSFAARAVWENTQMKNKFTSSVLHEGYIYGLDESILVCIDAQTGQRKWKGGRYGYGQLLLAGGHLIVLTESGELVLVRSTPERHQELARFSAIDGKTWNHPAIADGLLLVRNTTQMACFKLSAL